MCILALITSHSPRFPFILATNRDEVFERLTHALAVDAATGLLWAVDGVAGGSWLGLELTHGRLATVTNCRRAPSAPLLQRSEGDGAGPAVPRRAPEGWRGAAPLEDTVAHTKCVPDRRTGGRTLLYEPPTSRGNIVGDFLLRGQLPQPQQPPFFAGYNLVTCDGLFGGAAEGAGQPPFTAHYTSNRFFGDVARPLAHGTVHCLQNSFMDNWAEPKAVRLRGLFEDVLRDVVDPADQQAGAAPLTTAGAQSIATAFADRCLSDTVELNVRQRMADAAGSSGGAGMSLVDLIHSTDPRCGLTGEELASLFGDGALTDGGAAEAEAVLQNTIFKKPVDGYGTRVQSFVMAERLSGEAGDGGRAEYRVHFCQRPVTPADAVEGAVHGAWVHYVATREGAHRVQAPAPA